MKNYNVTVNGKVYSVTVEEVNEAEHRMRQKEPIVPADAPAPKPAVPAAAPVSAATAEEGDYRLESPMPGVIINILVKIGDKIEKNQPVVILEAMKMENEISAPISGTVSSIAVSKGESVDPGGFLLTIKP